jgi:uncharacterized protein (TIGR02118 family)
MTARLLVLYNQPTDPAAFNSYYFGTHVPIASKLPGLLSNTVSEGTITAMTPGASYYLIAELEFESLAAIQAALGSPEGRATAADVGNFATGGATILMYEAKER